MIQSPCLPTMIMELQGPTSHEPSQPLCSGHSNMYTNMCMKRFHRADQQFHPQHLRVHQSEHPPHTWHKTPPRWITARFSSTSWPRTEDKSCMESQGHSGACTLKKIPQQSKVGRKDLPRERPTPTDRLPRLGHPQPRPLAQHPSPQSLNQPAKDRGKNGDRMMGSRLRRSRGAIY